MSTFQTLYTSIMNNPKAEKIEYMISPNYVKNLDAVFGIKEFIANFYDANDEDFSMSHKNKLLALEDQNTGIDIQYMLIGNSGSREDKEKIGMHGEGFKIGALTLVRLGHRILIETVGYSIAFGIEEKEMDGEQFAVMYAKFIRTDKKVGTKCWAECTANVFKKAKGMFLHLSDFQQLSEHIVVMDTPMKNIYLHGLSHTTKKALFGYNLFEKALSSNRDRNFISHEFLKQEVMNIYEKLDDDAVIGTVMEAALAHKDTFDKLFESNIFPYLNLTDSQKERYRSHLPKGHHYRIKGANVTAGAGLTTVDVDVDLYRFLETIEAPTLSMGEVGLKIDGSFEQYAFSVSRLPKSEEVEKATSRMLFRYMTCKKGKTFINHQSQQAYYAHLFPSCLLDDVFTGHKHSVKVTTSTYGSITISAVLNNLLLLACHDFAVTFFHKGVRYTLKKDVTENHMLITVLKAETNETNASQVIIQKNRGFLNGTLEEPQTAIYVGCLRYEDIKGLYSYQIADMSANDMKNYDVINRKVKGIIEKICRKNQKSFLYAYMKRLNDVMYEHTIDFTENESFRQEAHAIFREVYPNTVLSNPNAKQYDELIRKNYGYRVLTVNPHTLYSFLRHTIGIPCSKDVFLERQDEDILVVDKNQSLKEAIALFEQMTPTTVRIEQTPILPNGVESLHKEGIIYISAEASGIPLYLASLIAYEHSLMKTGYAKASREMQSHLTHTVLP